MAATWREEHLETFIIPYLWKMPELTQQDSYVEAQWTPAHIRALVGIWNEAKKEAGHRPILLAGRDVYLFEVLARIEGFPTTFRPDISSTSVTQVKEDYSKFYCIDTGNKGTIPNTIGCEKWHLINYYGYREQYNFNSLKNIGPNEDHLILPHRRAYSKILSLYSLLEGVCKYWVRAEKPGPQALSDLHSFNIAAWVTLHIANQVIGRKSTMRSKPKWRSAYVENDHYFHNGVMS